RTTSSYRRAGKTKLPRDTKKRGTLGCPVFFELQLRRPIDTLVVLRSTQPAAVRCRAQQPDCATACEVVVLLLLKERQVLSVSLRNQLRYRHKSHCCRVHAVTLTSRARAVVEEMSKM